MGRNGRGSIISGTIAKIIIFFTIVLAIPIGAGLGFVLAETANVKNIENFDEFIPALPTKILDINGTLITEFSADEKRELISLNELPRHLIQAVLAREDIDFYNHRGFSIRGIIRAAYGQFILKQSLGGGSTITQQVAGTLYTDRSERTISRKIKELWWALQLERRYTKNEILEIYLNYMYMGPGVYGVEAASKYFFGKSAKDISIAEAALLVVQLSSPARYNPLENPNVAMNRQRSVLDRMVEYGYITREEAELSFDEYWDNYDYTRASSAAFHQRDDRAPWFSEYVRRELDRMMYGTMDYYRDGYIVYTTLDLRHQESAERYMADGLERANREYLRSIGRSSRQADRTFVPVVDLLSLIFNLSDVHSTLTAQNEQRALAQYSESINPVIDIMAMMFDIDDLRTMTSAGFTQQRTRTQQNVVEGALISIENQTGYITAIVGGSKYDASNQYIRATQASVQPGSAFKPFYYSAAIDSRRVTAATLIYDVPVVFYTDEGDPHIPQNYGGLWRGPVLMHRAMSLSLNIPSLKVLDAVGFDEAIDRSAALLGITDQNQIDRLFPRVFPLGLGISSVSPLRMARAFAVFGNQGQEVTPIAIRYIEDRNGRVVLDLERDLRMQQQQQAGSIQVVSQQNAYVMTRILERGLDEGILTSARNSFVFTDDNGRSFRMPVAGKTGTTQNWSDAWVVGYTPYYTTAIWFGFDQPGNSLGESGSGAQLSAPVWANYMNTIHQGLPYREFNRPSGVIDFTVCSVSGMMRNPNCNEGTVTLPFLSGTQPTRACTIHDGESWTATAVYRNMQESIRGMGTSFTGNITMPDDLLRPTPQPPGGSSGSPRDPFWTFIDPGLNYDILNLPPLPPPPSRRPPPRSAPSRPQQQQPSSQTADVVVPPSAGHPDDPASAIYSPPQEPEENEDSDSMIFEEITVHSDQDGIGYGMNPPSHNPLMD
ncbi:MAG: PBP1A family penicillin-binding protein [Treponema sp.]|nr:PBP1A family penicillin-binding protein [Treponema sp.]